MDEERRAYEQKKKAEREEEKRTAENIVRANAKNFYAIVEKVVFLKSYGELAEVVR